MKTVAEVINDSPLLKSVTAGSLEPTQLSSESSKSSETSKKHPPLAKTVLPALNNVSEKLRRDLLGLDEAHHPKVKVMSEYCEWWFRRCLHNEAKEGTKLILAGAVGCGKTMCAKALFKQVQAWGVEASFTPGWGGKYPFAWWVDWPSVCELERETAFADATRDVVEARVVFLDDIGSEADKFKNGESASRLRRVLQACDRKWLLITTNLIKKQFAPEYDVRVADRLSAAHWCDLSGVQSYRPKLIQRNPAEPK